MGFSGKKSGTLRTDTPVTHSAISDTTGYYTGKGGVAGSKVGDQYCGDCYSLQEMQHPETPRSDIFT